jgi:hypothetical protein
MKYKFFNLASSFGIGLVLFVITIIGLLGCEKEGGKCGYATSSSDECVACLNSKGGCPIKNGSWGYSFSIGVKCECN